MIRWFLALACAAALIAGAEARAAVYVGPGPDGAPAYTDAPSRPGFQHLPAFGLPPGVDLVRGQYAELIEEAAAEHAVDPALVRAIIRVESNFQPHALSRKGAQGLMQLMPATANRFAVNNAFDPRENVRGGVRYLRNLLDLFPASLSSVLAAYNAGEGAVQRHKGIPPYPETREYVARVLAQYRPGNVRSGQRMAAVARSEGASAEVKRPIYRSVEVDGTPRFTDLPPLVRTSKTSQ